MNRYTLISALLLFAFFSGCTQPQFEFEKGGVKFYSSEAEPKELLRGFSLAKTMIVEAQLSMTDQKSNVGTFNQSFIPFYTVVAGNDVNAIQFLVFKETEIVDCQTNFGSLTTQEFLAKEECIALKETWGEEKTVVFLPPDPNVQRAGVFVESNKAIIVSSSLEEQAIITGVLMEVIYPNAQAVLERSKQKLKQLN